MWAKEQSRLERKEIEWFEFAAFASAHGLEKVHTLREGILDVGGVVAGLKAVLNAHEVRQLKQRINERLDKIAEAGQPPGSMPFGYRHAVDARGVRTYVQVPEQAEAIQWAAGRILAGWSLSSVAAELRRQGLAGPHRVKVKGADGQVVVDEHGQPVTRASNLTAGSVRQMVTIPTVAGFRVHRGQIVGKGNWLSILDEDVWQACRAKLSGRRTVERVDGGTYPVGPQASTARKYLLTGGVATCGVCTAPLVGSLKQLGGGKVMPYLLCNVKKRGERVGKGCIGIMLEATEQYVVDLVFEQLDRPQFLDLIAVDEDAERREEIVNALAAVESQRGELAKMWATPGGLTMQEWQAARGALTATEQELRAELDEKPPPPSLVTIEQARSSWEFMELGERREFLRMFVERVVINRAVPGTKGFDPGRVAVTWRYVR